MSHQLQDYLSRSYERGCLTGVLNLTLPICVDDHCPSDFYHLFCRIQVQVKDDHNFKLQLLYVPTNAAVLQLVQEVGGEVVDIGPHKDIRINLHVSDWPYVQRLAKAIKRVVGRRAHYDEKNWKWMCPRTARSLDKLAARLKRFELRRRNGTLPKLRPLAPAAVKVSPTVSTTSTRKVRKAAVQAQSEEDDEENLYKICGVE